MLTQKARDLAQGANYAVVSSVLPSGQPQSHVMWVDTDGTDILINTLEGRQKLKNMEANPLVTVTIISGTDFFDWVEIRGRVVAIEDGEPATAHIDKLSEQYFGGPFGGPRSPRAIIRIKPERVVEHNP